MVATPGEVVRQQPLPLPNSAPIAVAITESHSGATPRSNRRTRPSRVRIGRGSIGLATAHATAEGVKWQTIIHSVFILSAIGIAWTDYIMQQTSKTPKPE